MAEMVSGCLGAMLNAHAGSAALQKRRKSGGRKKKVQLEDGEILLVDPTTRPSCRGRRRSRRGRCWCCRRTRTTSPA